MVFLWQIRHKTTESVQQYKLYKTPENSEHIGKTEIERLRPIKEIKQYKVK